MTDPQTPTPGTAKSRIAAAARMVTDTTRVSSSQPIQVLQVDEATLPDAVALLRAGLQQSEADALAILDQVDPRELCYWLAYLADYYGKRAYGSAEALDEALAAWQAGGVMPLPE
ncbi:hypothetical protein [Streptosporangium sp. G12]